VANLSKPEAPASALSEPTPAQQARAREAMVREQIEARGVRDPRVLEAMRAVPRHLFVPAGLALEAHADRPLPIGSGQTISQPYIVAAMAEALELTGSERVLEVGSGCGYMAAVLSALALEVYGVELEPELHGRAVRTLAQVGCSNVTLACGDGALGWPERAPFDAIVLSCATTGIPAEPWLQLAMGGRIILPMGAPQETQELILVRKTPRGSRVTRMMPVGFVPLRRGRDLPSDR
jgi:protein-L-isoaspartate(D-aspartate) O-methyltransferase